MFIDPNQTPVANRQNVVSRINGGTTIVTAAKMAEAGDLAFAIRFLMDHFTYKRSKGSGTRPQTVREVVGAAGGALDSYVRDVAEPLGVDLGDLDGPVETGHPVSKLGQGQVSNPFDLIGS